MFPSQTLGKSVSSLRLWSTPQTVVSSTSSSWVPALPVAQLPPRWARWATTSTCSSTRIPLVARTPLQRRVVSTLRRTTATTTTPSTASSTTPLRAATTAHVRPTSTVWLRLAQISSTSASRRACPSHVNTAACSTTAPSVVSRCRVPSTHVARQVSSC